MSTNATYSVTETQRGSLGTPNPSMYTNIVITNFIKEDVALIYRDGSHVVLPTVPYNCVYEHVVASIISFVGPTAVQHGGPVNYMPCKEITISRNLLEENGGGIYVPEMDFVVAFARNVSICKHPKTVNYEQQVTEAKDALKSQIENGTFTLLVNDPTKTLTKVYTELCGNILEICVTNQASLEDTPTLKIFYNDSGTITSRTVLIDEILKDEMAYIDNAPITFLAKSPEKAEEVAKATRFYSPAHFDAEVKRFRDEAEKRIAIAKTDCEIKLRRELDKVQTDLNAYEKLKVDYDKLKAVHESFVSEMQGVTEARKQKIESDNADVKEKKVEVEREKTEADKKMSDNDVKISDSKASSAAKEDNFKTWALVAGAVFPTLAIIAWKLFDKTTNAKYLPDNLSRPSATLHTDVGKPFSNLTFGGDGIYESYRAIAVEKVSSYFKR